MLEKHSWKKKLKKKKRSLEVEKETQLYKDVSSIFPDVDLIDVKDENE